MGAGKGEGPDACPSKANKQARSVERKVCFEVLVTLGGGWRISVQRLTPSPDKHGVRAFIDRVGDAVTCRNSIVVSNSHLQSAISGLTSIILLVLGKVSLQFWGALVLIFFVVSFQNCGSSSPGLSLVIEQLTLPPGVLVSLRQLTRYGSEYYLQPLRKN